ncbi:glycosyltransferase family 4 protein [Sphingomonas bacterium]|uniref:glycosyltransferase family 4 protein n=1 Tax=Sphingomonas bacterium TaxID=1895847 RepID=UPI0015775286|nr:glycosyltransferase family 4 protein [Sphingomonas bacterium]
MGHAAAGTIRRLALIGNFLPRQCGLATFTTDVFNAMRDRFPDVAVDVYAMDDKPGAHAYPPEVTCAIPEQDLSAYVDAARAIEANGADAIWLQHEYGIYGGVAGDHILQLLDRTTAPLIVTLHTILEQPNPDQRRVMEGLLRRAARVVVMAERGREILTRIYGANPRQLVLIPHGVPDRALVEPDTMKGRFGWAGRQVVLTFGLLSPGKGIETVIEGLPAVVAEHPDLLYVVLGATHPHLLAREGEAYRDRLKALAVERGVGDHVAFVDEFVLYDRLIDYLQAADVYCTPYKNAQQITSGTLSYAVGMGKAVVSTPYVHATEILADDHGVLVPFGDVDGFSRAIAGLLSDPAARRALEQRVYARGRTMIWSRLAEAMLAATGDGIAARPRRLAPRPAPQPPLSPDLAAVERMSDSTGMLQHSIYSVPDRRHGYCIDDNARALMLMNALPNVDEVTRDKWTTIYASFIQYAWNPDVRRYRNFMRFDRSWCEEVGSEDSNGRALWALAVTARDARDAKHRDWAVMMFDATASLALELQSLRAQAFAMLGAAAMLEARPGHELALLLLRALPDTHLALLAEARRPEWQWFEIVLAYDNARLPHALIAAGRALGRQDLVDCGLSTLAWICDKQTSPEGRFRAVGTESFGRPYAEPLKYDQQPLEAQATVEACVEAFRASRDPKWLREAERAYRWFLGANDLDLPLASRDDGGCFDGLMPTGLNRNQGAESILALQLASCAISGLGQLPSSVAGPVTAAA